MLESSENAGVTFRYNSGHLGPRRGAVLEQQSPHLSTAQTFPARRLTGPNAKARLQGTEFCNRG